MVDGKVAGKVKHKPQLLKSKPFAYDLKNSKGEILIAAVDTAGNRSESKLT
jgi:hypothetical protein